MPDTDVKDPCAADHQLRALVVKGLITLSFVALLGTFGVVVFCTVKGREVPSALSAILGALGNVPAAGLGALAAFLVKSTLSPPGGVDSIGSVNAGQATVNVTPQPGQTVGELTGNGEQVAAAAEEEEEPDTPQTTFPARGEGVLPLAPDAKPGEV